ncbi:unnamed protein product [Amoebophrya sp. A120]|nr:unnamed protein product [Amoebophrya sp. A120]|eukprot:GSA120T00002310001.1
MAPEAQMPCRQEVFRGRNPSTTSAALEAPRQHEAHSGREVVSQERRLHPHCRDATGSWLRTRRKSATTTEVGTTSTNRGWGNCLFFHDEELRASSESEAAAVRELRSTTRGEQDTRSDKADEEADATEDESECDQSTTRGENRIFTPFVLNPSLQDLRRRCSPPRATTI